MRMQEFARRAGWVGAGAAAALLLAACAGITETPGTASEPVAGTSASQNRPSAGVPSVPLPEAAPVVSEPRGGAGIGNPPPNGNTIVVTGNRVRRDDFSSPNATITVTAEDLQNLGVVSVADMIDKLESGQIDLSNIPTSLVGRVETVTGASSATYGADAMSGIVNVILDAPESASAGAQQGQQGARGSQPAAPRSAAAAGANTAPDEEQMRRSAEEGVAAARLEAERRAALYAELVAQQARQRAEQERIRIEERERQLLAQAANQRSPFSRVSPGEELWIIGQVAPEDMQAAVPEDALGPGVMVARFTPVVFEGEPQPLREIPLPLRHTDVDAKIQGYVGTVDVTQQFENPYDQKIEAVYMFPLPEKAAVSEFVMTIGERKIRGILRERAQAEQIYREARAQGYQASLLTQHRPNVFEQRVANIEPGKQIDVNIRYYETLAYSDGWYSFVFPTVVGPRYNPPGSKDPLLALPATSYAPTPAAAVRYLTPGTTSAHDISIAVELDAGVEIEEIESSHAIETRELRDDVVRVNLRDGSALPNEDFRLDFRVAGDTIKSNLLTYVDEESGDGYFTLMLYPPAGLEQLKRQPLELVFVLDCSGSMNGAPIQQAKAAIVAALDRLEPDDTFQIIRFSQNASQFGPAPVPATPENLRAARDYVYGLQGTGGTQMIEGIRAALGFPHDEERLRFVTFLTDGFIGNETDILAAIDRNLGASRIFSFGVGSSPNRYLLERMASSGRGAVAWLSLEDSGRVVMDAFFDRISHPAMIDVEIDYGGMAVSDVYPRRLPDLFVGRPVVVTGRFEGRPGDVELRGRAGGERVAVNLPRERTAPEHAFLPNLWARLRIADLNDELAANPGRGTTLAAEIRRTALAYELMSDYTAFIAVDASQVTAGSSGTTVYQAVPVPEGVSYETTVGR